MAKLPDKDTLAKEAAREALNFEIMGRTFREWLEILAIYVAEHEEAPKEANLFFYDAKKDVFIPYKYEPIKTSNNEHEARKKGKWIKKTETIYCCNQCGRTVFKDIMEDMQIDYPYCHCGADMREGGGIDE